MLVSIQFNSMIRGNIILKLFDRYICTVLLAGYVGDGFNTIIVLTACYLPDKRRRDYHYVMRNLFLYVVTISTFDRANIIKNICIGSLADTMESNYQQSIVLSLLGFHVVNGSESYLQWSSSQGWP